MPERPVVPAFAYIDIHCHQPAGSGCLQIVSMDIHELNKHVVNKGYYSLGLHPWFIAVQDNAQALASLSQHLATDSRLLAVGECGLDKAIATDFEQQLAVFQQQIILAEAFARPVIIHCVRAYNELIRVKKACSASTPWIVHGFNSHLQIARDLLKHGCYLSFGQALLRADSQASRVIAHIPADRLFLETDDSSVAIAKVYAHAARLCQQDLGQLQQQLLCNFNKVFFYD